MSSPKVKAMAIAAQKIQEHDVVQLRERVGRWPAGHEGTVIAEKGMWKQIEIADDQGVMLDLISVAEPMLELVWSPRPDAPA
jgi:hypothetical protein